MAALDGARACSGGAGQGQDVQGGGRRHLVARGLGRRQFCSCAARACGGRGCRALGTVAAVQEGGAVLGGAGQGWPAGCAGGGTTLGRR
jgi:hypothetical protein